MSGTDGERKREGKKLALSITGCNDNICQGIIFFPIVSFILNNSSDGNFLCVCVCVGGGQVFEGGFFSCFDCLSIATHFVKLICFPPCIDYLLAQGQIQRTARPIISPSSICVSDSPDLERVNRRDESKTTS